MTESYTPGARVRRVAPAKAQTLVCDVRHEKIEKHLNRFQTFARVSMSVTEETVALATFGGKITQSEALTDLIRGGRRWAPGPGWNLAVQADLLKRPLVAVPASAPTPTPTTAEAASAPATSVVGG